MLSLHFSGGVRIPRPVVAGIGWLACGCLLLVSSGCNLLIPLGFLTEQKEKIPAEFDKLNGKRVAVVVWAPAETLFDYPHVRLELSLHIADRLAAHLRNADLVDGRKIEDELERTLEMAVDPEKIGRQFQADMTVYVELLEFQIRDPDAPDYLRARIRGSVAVYDLAAAADQPRRYSLEEVKAVYPENGPVLLDATNSAVVRKESYEQFADLVARKFYEYEKEL